MPNIGRALTGTLLQTRHWRPERLVESAWTGHIPFAFWLITTHQPRVVVELGTHNGASYSALCQAVATLGLHSACYAVDTWQGDPHAGFYGEEVFTDLREYHEPRYGAFSRLIRSTFDEALGEFDDGTIDLLHIDGCHTYDAVRHDYENWKSKLSERGVVLFHDINVRERNFGVWRLWAEESAAGPNFAFLHSHGLGILGVGTVLVAPVRDLLAATGKPAQAAEIRNWFAAAGRSVENEFELMQLRTAARHRAELAATVQDISRHRDELAAAVQDISRHRDELAAALRDLSHQRDQLQTLLAATIVQRDEAMADLAAAVAERRRETRSRELLRDDFSRKKDSALAEADKLRAELARTMASRSLLVQKRDKKLRRLRRSLSWRATKPLRFVGARFKLLVGKKQPKRAQSPMAERSANNPRISVVPSRPTAATGRRPEECASRIQEMRAELAQRADQFAAPICDRTARVGGQGSLPWLAAQDRAPFRALNSSCQRGRIAVVVHVYYPELWPEMAAAISNIDEPFDLFVTLVANRAEALRAGILTAWPSAHVLTVENNGRDILPFLLLLRTGVLFRYALVCKLHTKRSDWHEDGESWRRSLIAGVLGSTALVRGILHGFDTRPELGMVVADGHLYSGPERWEGNRKHLMHLFEFLNLDESEFNRSFAGGSIFWIRPAVLRLLSNLPFQPEQFELEPLGNDGCLVHAIERLVSLVCYEAGMTVMETGAVIRQDTGAPHLDD